MCPVGGGQPVRGAQAVDNRTRGAVDLGDGIIVTGAKRCKNLRIAGVMRVGSPARTWVMVTSLKPSSRSPPGPAPPAPESPDRSAAPA